MGFSKAILFDLDDTLLSFGANSHALWREACEGALKQRKDILPAENILPMLYEVKHWYWSDAARHKRGRESLIAARREIVALAFSKLDIQEAELAMSLADRYSTLQNEHIALFSGTIPTLTKLKERGLKLGLITNGSSDAQRGKLKRFGLATFFDTIMIDQEQGVSKPDPRIFRLALGALDIAPAQACMVGDNLQWDIAGAQSAGIFGIWADYARKGLPNDTTVKPDAVITKIEDVFAVCDGFDA